MNLKKLLTQSAIAVVAICGEMALTYFFNRKKGFRSSVDESL